MGGVETWQVYGFEGELVAEYNVSGTYTGSNAPAAGTPDREYGYRNGQMLVIFDNSETDVNQKLRWLVTDHLGSTRMEVGKNGALSTLRRHDYAPFGEELQGGQRVTAGYGYMTAGARQKFGSKERDNETGLDFFEARYYANVQGRFTSPDEFQGGPRDVFNLYSGSEAKQALPYAEIANPQSLNKYQYAYNNPLRYIDPDGHMPDGDDDIITRVINSVTEVVGSLVGRLQRAANGGNPNPEVDHTHPLGGKEQFINDYMQEAGKRADLAYNVVSAIDVTGGGAIIHGYMTGNKTEMGLGAATLVFGQFGKLGNKAAHEALGAVAKGTAEEGIQLSRGLGATRNVIPTRQEAEKLIASVGGRIDRIERGAHATVSTHNYPHINYTVNSQKFTVRVQSVRREFHRLPKKQFPRE